jgi:integrase
MPRPRLAPGEHSEPEAIPYRLDAEGRKVRAENMRQATTWRARCQIRAIDGTRSDLTRWAKTKRDALAALDAALADRKHASTDGSLRPSTPFVEAGVLWLAQQRRPEARKAERTIEAYQGAFDRYLDVEGCVLRGLTLAQANEVQRVLALLQQVADEHGSGAAKMLRTVLSGIFGMAVQRGVLTYNAARQTGAVQAMNPKPGRRDHRRSLTAEERAHVIETADAMARKYAEAMPGSRTAPRAQRKWELVADLLAFLAGTGVRISEARLTRWEHVNLGTGAVEVHGTKTASSLRGVNAPAWLLERLKRRSETYGAVGYLFASPSLGFGEYSDADKATAGETPVDPSNLQDWVREALDKAGLPWATSHSFRRTVATMLHEGGVPLVRIADQLGHANPTMTANVYLGRDLRGDKADLAALL